MRSFWRWLTTPRLPAPRCHWCARRLPYWWRETPMRCAWDCHVGAWRSYQWSINRKEQKETRRDLG
jgi:hypothetical protein